MWWFGIDREIKWDINMCEEEGILNSKAREVRMIENICCDSMSIMVMLGSR